MNWNPKTWKFDWKKDKDRWVLLLAAGLLLLVIAFPGGRKEEGNLVRSESKTDTENSLWTGSSGGSETGGGVQTNTEWGSSMWTGSGTGNSPGTGSRMGSTAVIENWTGNNTGSGAASGSRQEAAEASSGSTLSYEQQLEKRLEELLGQVDGVGTVRVMVVLKSSEEKVWHVDQDTTYSRTQETDSDGGSRNVENQSMSRETVITGQGSGQSSQAAGQGPLLEKEIRPEISGVVVSASGGGSPQVQAEISAAVEALFDLPVHRIKILKMKE